MNERLADVLARQVAALERAVPVTLRAVADDVRGAARDGSPVDTGELRDSWSTRSSRAGSEWSVAVENTAPHAPFVRTYDPGPADRAIEAGFRRFVDESNRAWRGAGGR